MIQALCIRPGDSVGVALHDLQAGQSILINGRKIVLRERIPMGHKFALKDIPAGESVVKYGYPIGKAQSFIPRGAWVHVHNISTNLSAQEAYAYTPRRFPMPEGRRDVFQGYRRPDGRAAVRNEVWILPGVGCVADLTLRIAAENQHLVGKYGLDGLYAFPHPFGCSQLGDDNRMTRQLLSALANHPNAGAVLVVSLGCENNVPAEFRQSILQAAGHSWEESRVRFMVCQETADELRTAALLLEELAAYAGRFHRESIPVSELVLGMKCGGSDGLSGITANPLLGWVGDQLIASGGSSILTEVPEMFGAEAILMNRCVSKAVFARTVEMVNAFKDYFVRHGQPVYENPAPGNYAGGISTLEDKSLGCVQKGGMAPVCDVLPYGAQIRARGLTLLSGPGSDLVSSTNLAAAGAHLILFTTGRGTPYCTAVPTLKVSTNTALYEKKRGWIDFNAGAIADGMPLEEAGERLYQMVLRIASGQECTRGERNGYRKIAIFKNGVTV